MKRSSCTICCLIFIVLFFAGLAQVSAEVLLTDEGTEGNAAEYRQNDILIEDESSIVKEGAYSLKITTDCCGLRGGGGRKLSKSFNWRDLESVTVWTYRPTEKEFWLGGRGSITLSLSGPKIWIRVGSDPVANWTKHTFKKSDFYYEGSNDRDITHMHWSWEYIQVNQNNRLYIDGFTVTLKEGLCMGTVMVSAVTVIALVAVGMKTRKYKNVT